MCKALDSHTGSLARIGDLYRINVMDFQNNENIFLEYRRPYYWQKRTWVYWERKRPLLLPKWCLIDWEKPVKRIFLNAIQADGMHDLWDELRRFII